MPTWTTKTVEWAPEGHETMQYGFWDYDRGGYAEQIICECEWKSQKRMDFDGSVREDYEQHCKDVRAAMTLESVTDHELAEQLRQWYSYQAFGIGDMPVVINEVLRRLEADA